MSGVAMYAEARSYQQEDSDQINEYVPLVKRVAYHLMSRLPPSVQQDDLIQAGLIGLLEALRNYDASQGASFKTYARIRIRGAMLDEIRKNDWAPRSVHRKARQVAEVVRSIENETGRDARDHEIAGAMDLSLEDYHRMLQETSGHKVFSYEELEIEQQRLMDELHERIQGPSESLQSDDFKRCLAEAIAGLPERERLVMTLYYDEELNLREIGAILGVSESRVCQIHSQAIIRLQARMSQWINSD